MLYLTGRFGVIKLLDNIRIDRFCGGDVSFSGFGITLLQKCQPASIKRQCILGIKSHYDVEICECMVILTFVGVGQGTIVKCGGIITPI